MIKARKEAENQGELTLGEAGESQEEGKACRHGSEKEFRQRGLRLGKRLVKVFSSRLYLQNRLENAVSTARKNECKAHEISAKISRIDGVLAEIDAMLREI